MTAPNDDIGQLVFKLKRAGDLESALARILSPGRLGHARGAARLAVELGRRFGHPAPEFLRRAALLHDVGKTLAPAAYTRISEWRGWPPDDDERGAGPALLHAPAGAVVAAGLGLAPTGVAAIRFHVTGRAGLSLTDKIIMAADAAEETRRYRWAAGARDALESSLELAVAFWLVVKVGFVRRSGKPIHPRAARTLASFDDDLVAEAETRAALFI